MSTPTREELIKLCKRGVVPVDLWSNRDSSAAQRQLGEACALLAAGCEFHVEPEPKHDSWWVTVIFPGFGYFDYGGSEDDERYYIPTRERLTKRKGKDWY